MIISSLNTCLGLKNKIELIRASDELVNSSVFFIQEAEITENDDLNNLRVSGFDIHVTNRNPKSRLCAYVKSEVKAKVSIADTTEIILIELPKLLIFGVYRPYKISNDTTYSSYLDAMIDWIDIRTNTSKDIVIIGDLNFDYNKRNNDGYSLQTMFQKWLAFTDRLGLAQTVEENTWSRIINEREKSSLLDHIYTNCEIREVKVADVNMSDHLLISISTSVKDEVGPKLNRFFFRNWKHYNKKAYLRELEMNPIRYKNMTVNEHEDFLGLELAIALNKVAPESNAKTKPNEVAYSPKIRALKNKKANMIKKARKNNDGDLLKRARQLDKEVKKELKAESRHKVRGLLNPTPQKTSGEQ